MLSVRRPGNAGDTTPLVATENQEPRLDTDRVAPNTNGADRGRPSRSGARGQEETESEDNDDSERNTQELRYYSDDGAESELGEPEGHARSRSDAASRGESRQKHHLFSTTLPVISSPSTDITLCDVITSTNVEHTRCTLPPS